MVCLYLIHGRAHSAAWKADREVFLQGNMTQMPVPRERAFVAVKQGSTKFLENSKPQLQAPLSELSAQKEELWALILYCGNFKSDDIQRESCFSPWDLFVMPIYQMMWQLHRVWSHINVFLDVGILLTSVVSIQRNLHCWKLNPSSNWTLAVIKS